jgi:hypothetical protein
MDREESLLPVEEWQLILVANLLKLLRISINSKPLEAQLPQEFVKLMDQREEYLIIAIILKHQK